ncbi:hypothetical protein INT43_001325 [Umbelopsis isabellina]|uniref:SMP-LTD domain-containing protein n=1 Tax=Mortierella isabellina TaxID=91625 RepID=A0A8H7PKR4_MORIS|nr:hypothetical protein INT43_001325 [Umbelopsis isabellina]
MWSSLLISYIAGGLTLFPVLAFIFILVTHLSQLCCDSTVWKLFLSTFRTRKIHIHRLQTNAKESTTAPSYEQNILAQQLYKVGWLRVTREDNIGMPEPSISDMVMAFIASKTNTRRKPAADFYFAVLRYSTLFLYDSEKQLDCKGVIIVSNHHVRIYPSDLQEYEVFARPASIKLEKKSGLVPSDKDNVPLLDDDSLESSSYFLTCERCIDKEDWYFALRRASKLPATKPAEHLDKIQESTQFDQAAMNQLIATIHSDEHHFHTQWLNALLGRIFFAIYKTSEVKQFLYQKVVTKVNKLNEKTPPFLGDIRVRAVHVGQSIPYFTQPRLLGIGPSGELTGECNINYTGGFKLEIEVLVKWKYSDRLRPLNLNIILNLTLNKIKGKILFKIKEPPTNRLWYGFYEPPDMDWSIEPVVWDKRIGYSLIINTIEAKLKEMVMENMVLPNMDDTPFFPTNSAGGIFGPESDEFRDQGSPSSGCERLKTAEQPSASASMPALVPDSHQSIETQSFVEEPAQMSSSQSLPELFMAGPDMHTQYELAAANTPLNAGRSSSIRSHRSNSTTTNRKWFTGKDKDNSSPAASEPNIPISSSPLRSSSLMSFAGTFLSRKKISPSSLGNDIEEPAPAQQQNSNSQSNGIAIPSRTASCQESDGFLSMTPDSLHSATSSIPIRRDDFRSESESDDNTTAYDSDLHGVFSSSLSISLNSPTLSVTDSKVDDVDDVSSEMRLQTPTKRLRSKSIASLAISEVNVNAPKVTRDPILDELFKGAHMAGEQRLKTKDDEKVPPHMHKENEKAAIKSL